MDFISQIIDAGTGEQFISVEEAGTVIGTDKVSLLLNSALIFPYFPVLISIKSIFNTPENEITVSREIAVSACKHILFKSVKVDRVASLQNITDKVNSEITCLKTTNRVTVVMGNQITYTIHSLYDYKIASKMPVPHEIFPFLVVFNHTYHSFPTSDTFLKLRDIQQHTTEPLIQQQKISPLGTIYEIEERRSGVVVVRFAKEEMDVKGAAAKFLIQVVENQGRVLPLSFFSDTPKVGTGGSREDGLSTASVYVKNDFDRKLYQGALDIIFNRFDDAQEIDDLEMLAKAKEDIEKFKKSLLVFHASINTETRKIVCRPSIMPEDVQKIADLIKGWKQKLLHQLSGDVKEHFKICLQAGEKTKYAPDPVIEWKISRQPLNQ